MNIKYKKTDRFYKLSEELYGNIRIINQFCQKYSNIDDFGNIIPLLKYTEKAADELLDLIINS